MQATMFKSKSKSNTADQKINEGHIYFISNFRVTGPKPFFNVLSTSYSILLTRDTKFSETQETAQVIPSNYFEFAEFDSLGKRIKENYLLIGKYNQNESLNITSQSYFLIFQLYILKLMSNSTMFRCNWTDNIGEQYYHGIYFRPRWTSSKQNSSTEESKVCETQEITMSLKFFFSLQLSTNILKSSSTLVTYNNCYDANKSYITMFNRFPNREQTMTITLSGDFAEQFNKQLIGTNSNPIMILAATTVTEYKCMHTLNTRTTLKNSINMNCLLFTWLLYVDFLDQLLLKFLSYYQSLPLLILSFNQ